MMAIMATVSTEMSSADRLATEAYLKDLEAEFAVHQAAGWAAREAGDRTEFLSRCDRSRSVWCEIQGVVTALQTNRLPF